MRGIGRMGLCLVALLVCSATAAATATAAEYEVEGLPEFGRCVPASPPKSGEYFGARCIKPAAGKGSYNWLPGPGAKPKFEATASLTKLETVGKYAIACSSGSYLGEYKTPKTVSLTIGLVGCLDQQTGKKCQTNPAKEAEIETTVPGELGFIKGGAKPQVGLDLKPEAPILFTCGSGPPASSGSLDTHARRLGDRRHQAAQQPALDIQANLHGDGGQTGARKIRRRPKRHTDAETRHTYFRNHHRTGRSDGHRR